MHAIIKRINIKVKFNIKIFEDMKTNKLMDEIRKSTPADTNKQVDLCVAIANRVFERLQERNMKQRDLQRLLARPKQK